MYLAMYLAGNIPPPTEHSSDTAEMMVKPTHLQSGGVQEADSKTKIGAASIRRPTVKQQSASSPYNERMTWIDITICGSLVAIMVGDLGWLCYLMRQTILPHVHPLTVNVTHYDNVKSCSSPAQQGKTDMLFANWTCVRFDNPVKAMSMVWYPHHDIQWLVDFGDCTFMLFDSTDCSGYSSSLIQHVAQKDKFGVCYDVGNAKPRSASVTCEKAWEATWCEKSDGFKERNRVTCGTSPVCKAVKSVWAGLTS
ncbi:hypothetical protein LTR95_005854 [Oleoguttula sp. CCFEE 5521]